MNGTIAELEGQLQKDKAAFNLARLKLASALAPAMPKPKAEDIFIAYAFEYGLQAALEESKRDPAYFELEQAPNASMMSKLLAPLGEAHMLAGQMMEVVSRREELLRQKDPTRKQHQIWMGREFVIDEDNQTIRYLDTGEAQPFVHDEPRPADQPATSKDRSR